MENVTGFAVEAEETNEVAAPNAIDVTEKGLVKFEDIVKEAIPAIPAVLTINGLEVDNVKLKDTIEKEVKTMKINGLGDKEGFDKAEAKLKELSKLRTGSNTWRTNVMKPVIAFQKGLKKVIDETGELCSEGEKYLEEILEPVRRAVELARIAEEERKDKLAEERAEMIVAMGGVFDGKGSYNYPHEPGIFTLASSLRSLSDEDFEKDIVDVKAAWNAEVARLQAIEDEKNAEEIAKNKQFEDFNAERTELRTESLEHKGFVLSETGYYNEATAIVITQGDILNASKDEWKALLNPAPKVILTETTVTENSVDIKKIWEESEPKQAPVQTFSPPPAFSSAFEPTVAPEPAKEAEKPVFAPQVVEDEKKIMFVSVPLQFNRSDSAYMTLPITAKMIIHIYPEQFTEESTKDFDVAFTGDFGGNLKYSIIRIPQ